MENILPNYAIPSLVEGYEMLAEATKRELDWCLMQLENIQTKRPVSDMASTKVSDLNE